MNREIPKLTLSEIEKTIIKLKGQCGHCDREIKEGSVKSYNHDDGIQVKDFDKKQWVYFHCYWCKIDTSIDKVMRKVKDVKGT